jgi:hypothetical protein
MNEVRAEPATIQFGRSGYSIDQDWISERFYHHILAVAQQIGEKQSEIRVK